MAKTGAGEKMATVTIMADAGEAASAGSEGMVCGFGIILFLLQ